MKVQFLTGIERIEMGTLPKPTIKAPNEVLLRVKAVGDSQTTRDHLGVSYETWMARALTRTRSIWRPER